MDFLMGADTLPGYISSPTRVTPRPPYTWYRIHRYSTLPPTPVNLLYYYNVKYRPNQSFFQSQDPSRKAISSYTPSAIHLNDVITTSSMDFILRRGNLPDYNTCHTCTSTPDIILMQTMRRTVFVEKRRHTPPFNTLPPAPTNLLYYYNVK
jgi:hypothetical protein